MMKHPFLLALSAGLLIVLLAFAAPLWHLVRGGSGGGDAAAPVQGLPWQAQAGPDGTLQVFGLVLGRDTLADAQIKLGDGLRVALVARLGEVGALEALADPFLAGFVSGRLVLAFDAPAASLQGWRARAPRSEPMDGGVRRFQLLAADLPEALRVPLAGLSFVPTVRLSEQDLQQRFGAPAEAFSQPGGARVLLYPALGLAATVGTGSRGVLEYVAPGNFEQRLGRPLRAAAAASAPG